MKEWVLSVCGMVFLTAVLYSVLPQGKTAKIIKSIFAIMCISVLIRPLTSLKNADFDFGSLFSDNFAETFYQENYLEYTLETKKSYLEKGLINCLNKDKIICEKVAVELFYDENMVVSTKKVSLYIKGDRIVEETEHIDIIDKAYSYLIAFVKTDKNLIEIL